MSEDTELGLGDAGKRAIAALREENKSLMRQLQKYEGIDPDDIKQKITGLESQLSTIKSDYEAANTERQALAQKNLHLSGYQKFVELSAGKIDPVYTDLLWARISPGLNADSSGNLLVGEQPINDAVTLAIQQYPGLAPQSVGSNQTIPTPADNSPKVIPAADFTRNLDAIAKGEVVIDHGAL